MKRVEDHQFLSAIAALTADCGYPPTFREMGERLGLNCSTTFARVDLLRGAGLILPSGKTSGGVHRQVGTKTRGLMLSAVCRENLVDFPVPGLPAQLCNDCHDDWMQWDDPVLLEIGVPFESDLQSSRERFAGWKQAAKC